MRRALAFARSPRLRILCAVAIVALVCAPSLLTHVRIAADPLRFNDDVRCWIFPYFHYVDPRLFVHDYFADYMLALTPIGYHGLYWLSARCGLDPATLSKLLPYVMLAVTAVGMGVAARRFGGTLGIVTALTLLFGSGQLLDRIVGGLERGFAYPLLAVALAALATGRIRLLAAVVVVSAAFYPVAGAIAGLALAALLLIVPAPARGAAAAWSERRRLVFVAATATLAAVVIAPTGVAARRYGSPVRPHEVAQFPESGVGGRFGADDRAPFPRFAAAAEPVAERTLIGAGPSLSPWGAWLRATPAAPRAALILVVLAGLAGCCLLGGDGAAARVGALALASLVGYVVARPLAPYLYLPQRYIVYPVPLLALLLAAAAVGLGRRRWPGARATVARAALATIMLATLAGRGSSLVGYTIDARPFTPLLTAVAKLPPGALIAGWPGDVIDDVPFVARRSVYLSYELHQAFHPVFMTEARRRMHLFIDAYFATELAPLLRLRDEGVTHLLVRLRDYGGPPPSYFAPFTPHINHAARMAATYGAEVRRQLDVATVFREGDRVLLDLSRLRAGTDTMQTRLIGVRP